MIGGIDWPNLGAMFGIVALCGGIGILILRAQLARFFATRPEHDALTARLERLDGQLAKTPTHEDMRQILDRLGEGQGRFEAMAARMDGIVSAIGRVETQVDMLVRAQLERERGGGT